MAGKEKEARPSRRRLAFLVATRFLPAMLVMGGAYFGTAGSLAWFNGWLFLGTLAGLMIVALAYLIACDPELLEKRLRLRERRSAQKRCVSIFLVVMLPLFFLPGLDWRFGWSKVPSALVFVGLAMVVAGYALFFLVIRFNSYASRVIEVQDGQKVIDTGPYAFVRHPMYAANGLIYLGVPLLLGSWWSMIPVLLFLPLIIIRVRDEEAMLRKELPGYNDYCAKVRWRIVPGLW
jgi:protein-S-isoprenylcysteine O-methyltransferase Ste14